MIFSFALLFLFLKAKNSFFRMPRQAICTNVNWKDIPPLYRFYVKERSPSSMVPHTEKFWKKKICKRWDNLQDATKKSWWKRQTRVDTVTPSGKRCTTGPVWLKKKCTKFGTTADLKRAQKFYRQNKKKGFCLSKDKLREFGCEENIIIQHHKKSVHPNRWRANNPEKRKEKKAIRKQPWSTKRKVAAEKKRLRFTFANLKNEKFSTEKAMAEALNHLEMTLEESDEFDEATEDDKEVTEMIYTWKYARPILETIRKKYPSVPFSIWKKMVGATFQDEKITPYRGSPLEKKIQDIYDSETNTVFLSRGKGKQTFSYTNVQKPFQPGNPKTHIRPKPPPGVVCDGNKCFIPKPPPEKPSTPSIKPPPAPLGKPPTANIPPKTVETLYNPEEFEKQWLRLLSTGVFSQDKDTMKSKIREWLTIFRNLNASVPSPLSSAGKTPNPTAIRKSEAGKQYHYYMEYLNHYMSDVKKYFYHLYFEKPIWTEDDVKLAYNLIELQQRILDVAHDPNATVQRRIAEQTMAREPNVVKAFNVYREKYLPTLTKINNQPKFPKLPRASSNTPKNVILDQFAAAKAWNTLTIGKSYLGGNVSVISLKKWILALDNLRYTYSQDKAMQKTEIGKKFKLFFDYVHKNCPETLEFLEVKNIDLEDNQDLILNVIQFLTSVASLAAKYQTLPQLQKDEKMMEIFQNYQKYIKPNIK